MIRKIVTSKEPSIRQKSKPIIKFDKKLGELVKDLKDTLNVQKDPEGVGLAAPQIGKNVRVFIADFKNFKRVVVNPEIMNIKNKPHSTKASRGKKSEILEGCLSLPNYYGPLKRPSYLKLSYFNEKGQEIIEEFKDFEAQIILHEIDHLEGVLFIDRLLEQKKKLYKVEKNEWEEVELT